MRRYARQLTAVALILAMTAASAFPAIAAPSAPSQITNINPMVLGTGTPLGTAVQNPTGTVEALKQQAAYQIVKSIVGSLGGGAAGSSVTSGTMCILPCGDTSFANSDQLATMIVQSLFQGGNLSSDTVATVSSILGSGSVTDVAASALGTEIASIESSLGLGSLGGDGLGTGSLSSGSLGGVFGNGAGDISGSGLGTGTGLGTGLGTGDIVGLVGGIPVPNSADAKFSFNATHSFVTGAVVMSPPNPLKNKSFTITATGIATPPSGSVAFSGRNPVVETKTIDTAGMYQESYTLSYTYYPPKAAPQPGTLTIKCSYRVSEFSAFGGSSGGDYTPASVSGGANFGSVDLGSSNLGNSGGSLGATNQLTGASQANGIFGVGGESAGTMNLKQALGVLTGGVDMPFGSLTNGVSNINVSIPGLDSFGSGLLSINDTIHNMLKGKDSPKTEQQQQNTAVAVQSEQTPDQVRKATFGSMQSILKTSAALLAANGMKASDIPKLYDKDSAYTSPKDAWDMNRLTRFMGGLEAI